MNQYKILPEYPEDTTLPDLYGKNGMVMAINMQLPSMHRRYIKPENHPESSKTFEFKRLHCLTKSELSNPSLVPDEFKRTGIAISIVTYKRKVRSPGAKKENICAVKMLAVDCDYDNDSLDPLDVFYLIYPDLKVKELVPTIIEAGHRLRLIYVLDESVAIPFNLKRDGILTLLARITKTLTDICNDIADHNGFKLKAEPQEFTKYIRPHGSFNEKDGSEIVWYITDAVYSLDQLVALLPPLPEWYAPWRRKKASGNTKPHQIHDSNINARRIKELLSIIQDIHPGHREQYLFVLYNQLCLSDSASTAKDDLMKYNQQLPEPLETPKVQQHVFNRSERVYKFKDSTIKDLLGLSDEYCLEHQVFQGKSNADRCKAYRAKKTREARELKEAKHMEAVIKHKKGMSIRQIAATMNVSKSTIQRWINS